MTRTYVKICGITTPDDARMAAEAGADYLGIIFGASPRQIDLARAGEIRAAVRHARLVGVFRDQPLDEVVTLATASGIDLVQLHGSESPAYCDDVLARTGKPVIKVFTGRLPGTDELAAYRTTSYFMFDLAAGTKDDTVAREQVWTEAQKQRRRGFRVFVAGALDAGNVRDAIRRSEAFAVDVCRGVEHSPGIKDPQALARFLAEARS